MLILTQDRCTVCVERTIASEINLDAPDGTPRVRGNVGLEESHFFSVWRQCLCRCKIGAWFPLDIPLAQKYFWTLPTVPLGDEAQVEARFGPFDDSANLDAS